MLGQSWTLGKSINTNNKWWQLYKINDLNWKKGQIELQILKDIKIDWGNVRPWNITDKKILRIEGKINFKPEDGLKWSFQFVSKHLRPKLVSVPDHRQQQAFLSGFCNTIERIQWRLVAVHETCLQVHEERRCMYWLAKKTHTVLTQTERERERAIVQLHAKKLKINWTSKIV